MALWVRGVTLAARCQLCLWLLPLPLPAPRQFQFFTASHAPRLPRSSTPLRVRPNPSLERDLHRHGTWPARRSLSSSASRAKCHPGSGPSAQTLGLMGQQIAIALSLEDENLLLQCLRKSAEIEIYRSWSPTPSSVQSFSSDLEASPFYIHNKAFDWLPSFERVDYVDRHTRQAGVYYRLANPHGPLLEYSRHPIGAEAPQVAGRLCWSRAFASAPKYDATAFGAWYSHVASWLRKHATKVKHGATEPWCLPGARLLLANEA